MRNFITNSSIANVITRFSGKATVMLRNGNTSPAMWPQVDCAGPKQGRGEPADECGTGSSEIANHGNRDLGSYLHIDSQPIQLRLQPASLLFQRIS